MYSRNNPDYKKTRKRMGRGKKVALTVVAALLVVALGGTAAFAYYINSINDQLTRGDKSQAELKQINDVLKPTGKSFKDPFYMMLIGSDRLDDDPAAGGRSDTNIVVRVDPSTNTATMVSIPRDTRIDIDGYGINKFNAAYNYEGAAGAIREASQLLNVDISHYAEVNFDELKDLVDAVGGVDIDVTERVDDPDADGTSAHPEWPRVIIEEGEQHLDGNQSLVFARSRAYVDGDFTRTANQRKLIMALVNKVLALPVTELPKVVQAAAKSVTTDLTVNDIVSLAQQFRDDGDLTIYSALVPSTPKDIVEGGNRVSYVINDSEATKEMMKLVEEGKDPSGVTASGVVSDADLAKSAGRTATGSSGGSGSGRKDGSSYYSPPGSSGSAGSGGGVGYSPGAAGSSGAPGGSATGG